MCEIYNINGRWCNNVRPSCNSCTCEPVCSHVELVSRPLSHFIYFLHIRLRSRLLCAHGYTWAIPEKLKIADLWFFFFFKYLIRTGYWRGAKTQNITNSGLKVHTFCAFHGFAVDYSEVVLGLYHGTFNILRIAILKNWET